MPLRGHGLTTKASRSRARSNPPEEDEVALAVQRLRDKLRDTQPFYLEEDVVVIPFPSSDSGNTSPVHGAAPTSLVDVPPFNLDDAVSPPGSPTRAPPPSSSNARGNQGSVFATTATTINLDVPLSPTLFLTAVNLLDTKAIARSRRVAMDALKLIGQGYSLIWQDTEFIVDAAKHAPTPAVPSLSDDRGVGRRSSSPAMGGVRAAVRAPVEPPSTATSTAASSKKSVSPAPTHRPAPHLVRMLDECMQSLLVYANKSHTLSQFITAHQPTLHLFCFIGSAARVVEEGGESGDEAVLLTDRRHTSSSSSLAACETVALPQRDVELELRDLNHLWETCGLAASRLIDHLRECYLIEFLLDAALPPAVCSARYDGVLLALLEKKRRLVADLASSRSPLTNMMATLPLRSLMGLLNMSASAQPKHRARLLDKLAGEGLLETVLQHIQSAIAEWLRWSSSSSSSSSSPTTAGPSSLGSSVVPSPPIAQDVKARQNSKNSTGSSARETSPQRRGRAGSPKTAAHWSERRSRPGVASQSAASTRQPSPSKNGVTAPPTAATTTATSPSSSQGPAGVVHLQYLPVTPPTNATTPASGAGSSTPGRGRKSRASRDVLDVARVRQDPPIVRLGFCIEVLLLLTSPNLRHPQEADELARNPKTASSAVVRATAWAEEGAMLESLVAYLLWIIAASSTAFEEEVSLVLFDVPTSLLASLQEQAMDCVLQLASYSSALYEMVVKTLERLLSDRLVLTVPKQANAEDGDEDASRRGGSPPARRRPGRPSTKTTSPTKASPGGTAKALSSTVHVRLTGAGGLLPLLVSLLSRADEAQKHAKWVQRWFAWLTTHLVPSAFECPTLTNGRRSTVLWGTAAAAAAAAAAAVATTVSRARSRSRSVSLTPPPPLRGSPTAPVLGRDLRRDEVASLLPYFRFGTRVVLETNWREGAEPFLARLAILAYHVVLGRRNNLSFGLASACYDVVAPLLAPVAGLVPGQIVPPGDTSIDVSDVSPAPAEQSWLEDHYVLVSTPSKTPSDTVAAPHSASPGAGRKRSGRSNSPRRGRSAPRAPRDSVQTFIPSPSRSPIFYEAYSPSSSDSPSLRRRSPPHTPSKPASSGKKRARSPSAEAHTPAPAQVAVEPPSPPPATAGSPLTGTRSTWRDRLSLRMFLSSLSLTGGSNTPQRSSGEGESLR